MSYDDWIDELEECVKTGAVPIPECVLDDTEVSDGAKLLYMKFLRMFGQGIRQVQQDLAGTCNVSQRQVQRYVAELKAADWLDTVNRGRYGNRYLLNHF